MVAREHHSVRQDLDKVLMEESGVAGAEEANGLGAGLLHGDELLRVSFGI